MENIFPENKYDTPDNIRRSFIDKYLMLGSRWYYHLRTLSTLYQASKCARKGPFDCTNQVFYSNQLINLIEQCGGKIHLRGLENLTATDDPVVLIGNHMSSLETGTFYSIVRPRRDFTLVLKQSLLNLPYYGDMMRALETIPVQRKNPREDFKQVLTAGTETLGRGKSIVLFPQSTYSPVFDPAKFNSLGVKLAKRAGVSVIPFALKTDFLSIGKGALKDLGSINREKDVYFEFGGPLHVTDGKKEHKKIITFIQSRLSEWNKQI